MRSLLILPLLAVLGGLVLALSGGLAQPSAGSAQSPGFNTAIVNEFPQALRFRLVATAPDDAAITDATLRYTVIGSGSSARAFTDDFESANRVTVEVSIPTGVRGYVPVGSEFVYYWELTLDDGSTLTSESETFVYLPPDKDWQSVQNDILRVYYHGNDEAVALRLLEAAERTNARIGALLATELEVVPVNAVLFASDSDLSDASPSRGEAFDEAVTRCGSQVAINIIFLVDISCGTPDRTDTLRHEFAHILTKAAGESALGKVPSWLDEGTAVLAQTVPGDNFTRPFELAVTIDRILPFSTMGSSSNDPSLVGLFYGQSYFMVRFLLERGGEEEFARLFATIKEGNRFDSAIEAVYGFTFEEFENEFRASYDLPPREQSTPAPTPAREQPAATPEPTQAPAETTPTPTTAPPAPEADEPTETAQPTAPLTSGGDGGRDISTVAIVVVGGGVVVALLAILAFLFSTMLGNRQPAATPASPTTRTPDAAPAPPPEPDEDEFDEWGPSS